MLKTHSIPLLLFIVFSAGYSTTEAAIVLTGNLVNAQQTASLVTYDIEVNLAAGDVTDYADIFDFSLVESSASLQTGGGIPYSRFSAGGYSGWNGGVDQTSGFFNISAVPPGPPDFAFNQVDNDETEIIGFLTINTTGLAPGTYSISIVDALADASGDFGGELFLRDVPDATFVSNGASFNISSVPEPSALVLLTLGMGFGIATRRRQRVRFT